MGGLGAEAGVRGIHITPATSAPAPATMTHVDVDAAIEMRLLDLDVQLDILHEVLARLERWNVVCRNLDGLLGQDVAAGLGCTRPNPRR